MNKNVQVTGKELQQYIEPILANLLKGKYNSNGIGLFHKTVETDNLYLRFTLSKFIYGYEHKPALLTAINDTISNLIAYRIMLERPDYELVNDSTIVNNRSQFFQDEIESLTLGHPGETIKECLATIDNDMPLFCLNMGMTPDAAQALLDGTTKINEEIAHKLEKCLNVDAQFWINLQQNHQAKWDALMELNIKK